MEELILETVKTILGVIGIIVFGIIGIFIG